MTHGLVAIGDSIANGHGDMQLGVQCQSFGLWLAQAGGWCFTKHSVGGSTSQRVVDEQLPLLSGSYAVGVLSVGANDVLFDWDAARFADNLAAAAKALAQVCERVLVLNLPAGLGRAQRVAEANEIIASVADQHGLLLVDVSDLSGPRLVRPDRVHPTALGQLLIADRAAALLGVPVRPSSIPLGRPDGRLGAGFYVGYAAGSVKQTARRTAKRLLRR